MKTILKKIQAGHVLSEQEATTAMASVCSEAAMLSQSAAFLSILQTRGEHRQELMGFIQFFRENMLTLSCEDENLLDTCGTGGDGANTFNISTASALLLSSRGVRVAKQGGRAVSSTSGSVDVMQALGLPIMTAPDRATQMLKRFDFTFLSAPHFNPCLAQMAGLRKELGIRTCLNIIAPLLNPFQVKRQVIGVYEQRLLPIVASIMQELGSQEVMVVHSRDRLDEFSIHAPTDVAHLKSGTIQYYTINPSDLGFQPAALDALHGGSAIDNACIIDAVFQGEISARRDVVVLNAAAGFVVAGRCQTMHEGVLFAEESLDQGFALRQLNRLRQTEREVAHG